MMRGYFYPARREKMHSLGALDMALWDLKAKALDVPVWQLRGGKSRDHIECYATAFPRGPNGWAIDFHTELDPPDAINLATCLEPLHPYFVEDLIRSEA